jgi:2-hydroxymuconate-semialdehyde hydrolase
MTGEIDLLIGFVNHELLDGRAVIVDAETPLFEDGLIDSLNILRLIAFLETRRGREIPDRDVVMSRFHNVRTIVESFLA